MLTSLCVRERGRKGWRDRKYGVEGRGKRKRMLGERAIKAVNKKEK